MSSIAAHEAGESQTPLARAGGWVDRHPYLSALTLQALTSGAVIFFAHSAPDALPAQSPEGGFDPSLPWQSNFLFVLVATAIAIGPPAFLLLFVTRTLSPGRITALLVSATMFAPTFISVLDIPSKGDHDPVFADWAQERYDITLTADQVDAMRSGRILMIDGQAITISEADDGRLYLTGEGITNGNEGE